MQVYLGPDINKTSTEFIQPKSLRDHIRRCTRYVTNLELFNKYLIWRYTIGSASINSFLIFNKLSDNSDYWVYLFFQFWNNTCESMGIDVTNVTKPFQKFNRFFQNPNIFGKAKKSDTKSKVTLAVINTYINELHLLVKNCPVVKGEGFHVFKVASKYPGLPETNENFEPTNVLQIPFNSTTIDPSFSFAPFISKTGESAFFDIFVGSGSKGVLYIPRIFHAYSFEEECLLNPGVVFEIESYTDEVINYINPADVKMELVQEPKPKEIVMGEVYRISEWYPCGSRNCNDIIQSQVFPIFNTKYNY